jgi:hypothetical protein
LRKDFNEPSTDPVRLPHASVRPHLAGACLLVVCAAFGFASTARAQQGAIKASQLQVRGLDLSVDYIAAHSLKVNSGQNFWFQGGSIELGANAYRGWGIAANVTGIHASSIGTSGIPLSLVAATFGPRYRWHAGHKYSAYGEGLVGEANGFRSLFPAPVAAQDSANGLATQLGGGVDLTLSRRFAARILQASWLRTQLPNATNNVQNTLNLGAGFVLKF